MSDEALRGRVLERAEHEALNNMIQSSSVTGDYMFFNWLNICIRCKYIWQHHLNIYIARIAMLDFNVTCEGLPHIYAAPANERLQRLRLLRLRDPTEVAAAPSESPSVPRERFLSSLLRYRESRRDSESTESGVSFTLSTLTV